MKKQRSAWDKAVIRIGQVAIALIIIAGFVPSIFLYFAYGVEISIQQMITASLSIFVVYGVFYPVEPLAYYPSLGLAGTYLGFPAGNVGNMRVPAAVMAKQINEVEDGTQEAEICSIVGIAGSVVVNLVILTAGVFLGNAVMSNLPPHYHRGAKHLPSSRRVWRHVWTLRHQISQDRHSRFHCHCRPQHSLWTNGSAPQLGGSDYRGLWYAGIYSRYV